MRAVSVTSPPHSTSSSKGERITNSLESCDSFECMYADESKSEFVVSAHLISMSAVDNINNTTSASGGVDINRSSISTSLITSTMSEVEPMTADYQNSKSSSSSSFKQKMSTLADARIEKRTKENALQRSINMVRVSTPTRSATGRNVGFASSLVDLADDESKMTSVLESVMEEGSKDDIGDGDDVFDGVAESKSPDGCDSNVAQTNNNNGSTARTSSTTLDENDRRLLDTLSCSSYYEDDDAELTWRLHPSISLSDWNIEVVTKNNCSVVTYPVHKSIMAVGPRRSNFFVSEFQNHAAALRKASADAERAAVAERAALAEKRKVEEQQRTERILKQQQERDAAAVNAVNIVNNPFALFAAGCTLIGAPLSAAVDTAMEQTTMKQQHNNSHYSSSSKNHSNVGNHTKATGKNGSPRSVASDIEDNVNANCDGVKPKINIPNITQLELEELASDAFPFALDFMYSTNGFLDIRTDHATALFWISKKLEIKALQVKAEKFWKTDLTIDTITTYYQHARIFNEAAIIAAAEELFAQYLFDLSENAIVPYLMTFDAVFMNNVIEIVVSTMKKQQHQFQAQQRINAVRDEQPSLKEQSFSQQDGVVVNHFYLKLSILIAVYCNIHRKVLSSKMLWKLTDDGYLPTIDPKAAKSFLATQEFIAGPNHSLTSLTHRCVQVLSDHWNAVLSSQFGTVSLIINEPIAGGIETTSQRNAMRRDRIVGTSSNKSSYSSIIPEDVPSLGGDALEEFVALSLRNAKNQIMQLEEVNATLQEKNEQLERELKLMKDKNQHNSTKGENQSTPIQGKAFPSVSAQQSSRVDDDNHD